MTKTWVRIGLRSWFILSIAICLLAGEWFNAGVCGFFWSMTEF